MSLTLYDADGFPPGSRLHPDPAEAGSIMEQGVPATILDSALREFSDEDAELLVKELNQDHTSEN